MLALIMLIPLLAACDASGPTLVSDVSKELRCSCGCAEVLSTCDCTDADEMNALIEKKLAQGQSKEQILLSFVDKYGKQVLVAPTNP